MLYYAMFVHIARPSRLFHLHNSTLVVANTYDFEDQVCGDEMNGMLKDVYCGVAAFGQAYLRTLEQRHIVSQQQRK